MKEEEFARGDEMAFDEKPVGAKTLNEVFLGAYSLLRKKRGVEKAEGALDQHGEPLIRTTLPVLRDPNWKISVWAVLKDNLGKDFFRISFPISFNDPTGMLQRFSYFAEYCYLLKEASAQTEPELRAAFIATYLATCPSLFETISTKPFNPLLGETFELVTEDFKYIAEQVSHHPPITAYHIEGKNFTISSSLFEKIRFTGRNL